jgi:hypothetical protein
MVCSTKPVAPSAKASTDDQEREVLSSVSRSAQVTGNGEVTSFLAFPGSLSAQIGVEEELATMQTEPKFRTENHFRCNILFGYIVSSEDGSTVYRNRDYAYDVRPMRITDLCAS